jgi:hypothetical protein
MDMQHNSDLSDAEQRRAIEKVRSQTVQANHRR